MKLLFVSVCIVFGFNVFGQDTVFFNADWQKCSAAEASFYRLSYPLESGYLVRDMYMKTKNPQMTAYAKTLDPLIKHGKCTYYHAFGARDTEGNYLENKKHGIWVKWYSSGTDSSVIEYKEDEAIRVIRPGPPDANEGDVFHIVEKMPSFVGGNDAMMEFIVKNVKYPKKARRKGISGTCYITFVVEKDGKVSNAKVLRGVKDGELLNNEALRVVNAMPAWNPGTQSGRPVRVQFNLPIKFILR